VIKVSFAIPGDIEQVITTAPDLARSCRDTTREAFLGYLQRRSVLAVILFVLLGIAAVGAGRAACVADRSDP